MAGTGEAGFTGDSGPAIAADLNGPEGVTLDPAGNLYIADTFNHRVRRVALDRTISTFAGDGYPAYRGDNGPATTATLFLPPTWLRPPGQPLHRRPGDTAPRSHRGIIAPSPATPSSSSRRRLSVHQARSRAYRRKLPTPRGTSILPRAQWGLVRA